MPPRLASLSIGGIVLLAIAAAGLLTLMDAMIKGLCPRYPTFEITFLRFAFGMVGAVAYARWTRPGWPTRPDHPNLAIRFNNLGQLYVAQGRYTDAEPMYKHAIEISEKAWGPNHPDVGRSLNNLAELYIDQGRYAEAESLYQRILIVTENALGSEHPSLGVHLNNLASLYSVQGRFAEAEPLHKRALSIAETTLGPDHPQVGLGLNNLGSLYQDQGRHGEAEQLYKRALAISDQTAATSSTSPKNVPRPFISVVRRPSCPQPVLPTLKSSSSSPRSQKTSPGS